MTVTRVMKYTFCVVIFAVCIFSAIYFMTPEEERNTGMYFVMVLSLGFTYLTISSYEQRLAAMKRCHGCGRRLED